MNKLKIEVRASDGHIEVFDLRNPEMELLFRREDDFISVMVRNTAQETKALAIFYRPINVKFVETV